MNLTRNPHIDRHVPLHMKTQGPAALPIATLVERGESAAKCVAEEYAEYARTWVPAVVAACRGLLGRDAPGVEWNAIYTTVRDLRTSGQSAGHHVLAAMCASLEDVLMKYDRNDPRAPKVIDLHLDALALAGAGVVPEDTLKRLVQRLRRAAGVLTLGKGYVEP